jgi:hypothetical protein
MGLSSIPARTPYSPAVRYAVVPNFTAGAASVAPGTDKVSEYVIGESVKLSVGSTLTLTNTDSPPTGNYLVSCYSLSLGNTLTIAGSPGGNLGTIAESDCPIGLMAWFDGTKYIFNGYCYLQSRV